MKSEKELKQKLRAVKTSYLVKKYKERLSKKPCNCVHNYRYSTVDVEDPGHNYKHLVDWLDDDDQQDDVNATEVGLCMLNADNPEEWGGVICDDVKTAEDCPFFQARFSREDIETEFEKELEDDIIVAHNYKDIAALQWMIGEKVYSWDLKWYQRFRVMVVFWLSKVLQFFSRSGVS